LAQKHITDKSSGTAAIQRFAGVTSEMMLLFADGFELRSDLERTIWHQFSRAHAREDWCDMDLILLAKIVLLDVDIRTAQAELDEVGMMVENKRGTSIPNPLLSVIDTLERTPLAVFRSMSLKQTASDPRTSNGFAIRSDAPRLA
jgi:hypothetical protein